VSSPASLVTHAQTEVGPRWWRAPPRDVLHGGGVELPRAARSTAAARTRLASPPAPRRRPPGTAANSCVHAMLLQASAARR
jgi:hypothetical protein